MLPSFLPKASGGVTSERSMAVASAGWLICTVGFISMPEPSLGKQSLASDMRKVYVPALNPVITPGEAKRNVLVVKVSAVFLL